MAATQQQRTKGNPASKRMGNANLKARRARSWANGEARKAARRDAQDLAHRRNVSEGDSPWARAVATRFRQRHGG